MASNVPGLNVTRSLIRVYVSREQCQYLWLPQRRMAVESVRQAKYIAFFVVTGIQGMNRGFGIRLLGQASGV
jgi:hypothetical protein